MKENKPPVPELPPPRIIKDGDDHVFSYVVLPIMVLILISGFYAVIKGA